MRSVWSDTASVFDRLIVVAGEGLLAALQTGPAR